MEKIDRNLLSYRLGVGVMLFNSQKMIFVGKRKEHSNLSNAWQMPQGGIDEGENPGQAVLRELEEEAGTSKVKVIAETDWLSYELPDELIPNFWGGKFRGQKQKWYLMRLMGGDELINIHTSNPEFVDWRWEYIDNLESLIVPFKRELYAQVIKEFSPILLSL